jgi:hypothetical protein
MNFFNNAYREASSVESLEAYIQNHSDELYDIYSLRYDVLSKVSNDIDKFIQLKFKYYSQLDFSSTQNRSFLLIMLDLAERLNLQGAMARLANLVSDEGIEMTSRMQAGLSFVYPKPSTADDLVGKFDDICRLLQIAIEEEEDSNLSSLITFLNYYSAVVDSLHSTKAQIVRNKFLEAVEQNKYPFLNDVKDVCKIDVNNEHAYEQLQEAIDYLNFQNLGVSLFASDEPCLIEEGTEYANWINSSNKYFDTIRQYAVSHASDCFDKGRGVNPITEEQGLYNYLKNYGNMHKAKMLSALTEPFPQQFDQSLTIIDWGCGQGLASLLFCEKYYQENINQIILIEPSELAIKRASLHCKAINPECSLRTVCKRLDNVELNDIGIIRNNVVVNLFSNILDIDDYSTSHIISLMDGIKKTENYYVCVSPHINDIKTNKIDNFRRYFQSMSRYVEFHNIDNTKRGMFWMCNNVFKSGVINHGLQYGCSPYHDENGCVKKWTRVLRVFKVTNCN